MTIIDLFNDILASFRHFVLFLFNDLPFASGVTYGWMVLAITLLGIFIHFVYVRLK